MACILMSLCAHSSADQNRLFSWPVHFKTSQKTNYSCPLPQMTPFSSTEIIFVTIRRSSDNVANAITTWPPIRQRTVWTTFARPFARSSGTCRQRPAANNLCITQALYMHGFILPCLLGIHSKFWPPILSAPNHSLQSCAAQLLYCRSCAGANCLSDYKRTAASAHSIRPCFLAYAPRRSDNRILIARAAQFRSRT